jgi:DNA-binding PadR family transcriptional regulator
MSLKFALMGFLDIYPMSGYDLVKAFDYAALYYWHATHTQIYGTLKQMEKDGWIEGQVMYQLDNPNKRIFSVTEKGKAEFLKWLKAEPEMPGLKHAFLIKFTYSKDLSNEEVLGQLDAYENKLKDRLSMLRSEEKGAYMQMARDKRERFLWKMSNENGVMYYENEIEWIQKVRDGIRKGEI